MPFQQGRRRRGGGGALPRARGRHGPRPAALEAADVGPRRVFVPATLGRVWLGDDPWSRRCCSSTRATWRVADPRLLRRRARSRPCGRCSSRAASSAASSSTSRSRVGVVGIFFGGFEVRAARVQGPRRRRPRAGALPVPLRHDRLRRVLGLPRPRLRRHDEQADRRRDATAGPSATGRCCSRPSSR